jgi:site-specific DNA recombinase
VRQALSAVVTALLYTRVSREEQREGQSLDAQLSECRRYARGQAWIIGREFQDVMTGTRDDRPQYQELLAEVRRLRAEGRAVAVVVAALDRFGRKLLERVRCREELKRLGVPTHSVREGGEVSDLVANILASVAQEESRRLGERVRAVRSHLLDNGWHPVGRAPWGYRWRDATEAERQGGAPRKALEIDEGAAPYVRETFARVAGGETVRSVTRWLMRLPPSARDGRALGIFALRHALRAAVYVGRCETGGPAGADGADLLSRPLARWPALVDDETFRRVQERLEAHRRHPRQASGRYLLTGFIRCPRCGARMQGYSYGAGAQSRPRYRCQSERQGASARLPACVATVLAAAMDAAVISHVSGVLGVVGATDPVLQAELRRAWRALRQPSGAGDRQQRIRQLEGDAEKARERIRRATDLFVDVQIDKTAYDDKCARERSVLEAADAELARLRGLTAAPGLPALDEALRVAGDWGRALLRFDVPSQRAVLATLVELVVPVKVGFGKYRAHITWTPGGVALREAAEAITRADAG